MADLKPERWGSWAAVLGLVLLSACQTRLHGGSGDLLRSADTQGSAIQMEAAAPPLVTPLTEPTPLITDPEGAQAVRPAPTQIDAPAAANPLRFVFPTPGPVAVSAWRPPLYPVPWALTPYDHFYFHRPIAADEVNWPLADYRYGGRFFADTTHTGVDIPAPEGTPVMATGPGKVISAGYGVYSGINDPEDPYGLAVVIRHDFGHQSETLYTVYGHLSQVDVAIGQHVETGEHLGLVGQTGFTTGPHLHFEVRIGENRYFTTRNPELWVAPPMGWGVLAGRVMETSGNLAYALRVYIRKMDTGQMWQVISYGSEVARSDPYYRENLVIGDLPAGNYEIRIPYYGIFYQQAMTLHAGMVNYFTFQGRKGFGPITPPTPEIEFIPEPAP